MKCLKITVYGRVKDMKNEVMNMNNEIKDMKNEICNHFDTVDLKYGKISDKLEDIDKDFKELIYHKLEFEKILLKKLKKEKNLFINFRRRCIEVHNVFTTRN